MTTRQLTLRYKPALSTGSPTSDAAARAVEGKRPRLWWLVWRTLQQHPDGMTAEELETATGLSGNSVRPRLVELAEVNLVTRTERTRKTRQGRDAFVYVAVPQYGEK